MPYALSSERQLQLGAAGRTALTGGGLFALFAGLWALVHFSTPNLSGVDGYFHIRFAQVMRSEGLVPHFPWLPLTLLNPADYYDHHFLYHVLLSPFAGANLLTGAKLAGVLFGSLPFLMGWWLLRGQQVPYAALWALGFFAVSEAFLYRLSMIRVQAVSLALLLLALHLLLQQRHRWLLPLAFIYTWLYDAFPLLLAMIAIYVAVMWLFERKFWPGPLLYAVGGVALGLVINPYFPNNLWFIYHHYLPKISDITGSQVSVGSEWYPYRTWALAKNSGPMLLLAAAGGLALGLSARRMDTATALLFFMALFFGALLLKSRRFIEYTPAFVLLFCAIAWKPLLAAWALRVGVRLPALLLAVLLLPPLLFNLHQTRQNMADGPPPAQYAAASTWLIEHTPPGSRLFQTDWDDFSRLFFHNTHNTYLVGLDPTYLQLYNPALYELWQDTTRGWGNIGLVIKDDFGAAYALTNPKQYGFIDKAMQDPYLRLVYEDEFALIYEVLAEPDPNKKSWYSDESP